MARSTSNAWLIVTARKNTHASTAARNVSRRLSQTQPGVSPHLRNSTCTDWNTPHSRPQKTNVQAGPCHRPASRKVMSRLRTVIHVVPREPPSGMNR